MIDWSGAVWAGVWGGLAMEASAVLLRLLGFGKNSMVSYEGCMLTGRESSAKATRRSCISSGSDKSGAQANNGELASLSSLACPQSRRMRGG